MSKLDNILLRFARNELHLETAQYTGDSLATKTKQEIKNLVLEIIGEERPNLTGAATVATWNKRIREMRQEVNEL